MISMFLLTVIVAFLVIGVVGWKALDYKPAVKKSDHWKVRVVGTEDRNNSRNDHIFVCVKQGDKEISVGHFSTEAFSNTDGGIAALGAAVQQSAVEAQDLAATLNAVQEDIDLTAGPLQLNPGS